MQIDLIPDAQCPHVASSYHTGYLSSSQRWGRSCEQDVESLFPPQVPLAEGDRQHTTNVGTIAASCHKENAVVMWACLGGVASSWDLPGSEGRASPVKIWVTFLPVSGSGLRWDGWSCVQWTKWHGWILEDKKVGWGLKRLEESTCFIVSPLFC